MKNLFFYISLFASIQAELHLTHFKDHIAIDSNFLTMIEQLFQAPIFVETGTGGGYTTERAAQIFPTVYSVEIQPGAFRAAQNRLAKYYNIQLFNADSPHGLELIIPRILSTQKTIFFLDAHYNGAADGRSSKNTPILEELDIILTSQLNDPVIIIDDARTFRSEKEQLHDFNIDHCDQVFGYPHIKSVIEHIKKYKPNYNVYVFGDLIIAFGENIPVSPFIKFMTEDMLHNNTISYDLDQALKLLPKNVQPQEKATISYLVRTNILGSPSTYSIFFKKWHEMISNASLGDS